MNFKWFNDFTAWGVRKESDGRRQIRNLEIHLVHGCNLTCESCSHYSNQGHKGTLSLEEADQWMKGWNQRIRPEKFSLVGGEPTIHPKLPDFVALARKNWPDSTIRLVTNGFFLHRHPTLPQVMEGDPNMVLSLSIHHNGSEFRQQQQPALDLLEDWKRTRGITVKYNEVFKNWTRRYKGFGSDMEPYEDKQPKTSWDNCRAKYCYQLFEGKIWKCGPLAYLKVQNARHPLSEKWDPYRRYQPLASDCTQEELRIFFDLEEEPVCSMCPANPESLDLPNPLIPTISVTSPST